jgi:hypothetical protein
MDKSLLAEFNELMGRRWNFFYETWPEMKPSKFHRTEIKRVSEIDYIKERVLNKLGPIPVFFFLVVLFPFKHHPGPYRNVEKGLLIIYHLLEGCSHSDMDKFIPKSTFHEIHKSFYGYEKSLNDDLNDQVTDFMAKMFSNIIIRILSAQDNNPKEFNTVTLFLDGHDTRGKETGSRSEDAYSFKLRKSGFRTQVCIDVNRMVLFVSDSLPCKNHSDGVMFTEMDLGDKIDEGDRIALDGGYTLFVKQVVEKSGLEEMNFCYPIRKQKNIDLSDEEKKYNERFGSFRSIIEGFFGELGKTFEKFNNKRAIRTSDTAIFSLQFKVACLLLNVKKFVELGKLQAEPNHISWTRSQFDYPSDNTQNSESSRISTLKDTVEDAEKMSKYQAQLVAGANANDKDEKEMEDTYEVEKILNHKGKGRNRQYLVKWKGYKKKTWQKIEDFDTVECIEEYVKSQMSK